MRIVFYCLSLVLIGIAILYFFWLNGDRPNKHSNNFNRKFIVGAVSNANVHKLEEDVRDLVGGTHASLFFSTDDPNKLLCTDIGFTKKAWINIRVPQTLKDSIQREFSVQVDSPWVYIGANNIPSAIRYNISTNELGLYYKPGKAFTMFYPFSGNRYLFRELDFKTQDQKFAIYDSNKRQPSIENAIVMQQGDGGISTDGTLNYTGEAALFSYTLLYCDKVFVFDTSLNVIKKFNTIDGISLPQVKTGRINKSTYSNIGPARRVNLNTCISSGFLFVNSMAKADNESHESFNKNSPVDVYELSSGNYVGSFSVPRPDEREDMRSLLVFQHTIVAYYSHNVVVCKLDLSSSGSLANRDK